jgi:hypothetical protein
LLLKKADQVAPGQRGRVPGSGRGSKRPHAGDSTPRRA